MIEQGVDWHHWAQGIRSYFDKTILNRGWNYFIDGAVREITKEGKFLVKARVSGSSSYKVTIDLKSFMRSTCSCPYGSYCKHMAAVLFEAAEQDGFDPKELKNGGLQPLTLPKRDLTPKQAIKLPKPTGTCEEWLAYFDKRYGNSKMYNAFSVEEVNMRAWGELNKIADDWEPTIRGIYDILVILYLMRLCDNLLGSLPDAYDYYYQVDYYFMRIARHNRQQLNSALDGIEAVKAQQGYLGHLKELGSYAAYNSETGTGKFNHLWLYIYKLLWSRLLVEESLVKVETDRLRHVIADHGTDRKAREAAMIRLVHFDIRNGDDENAWERITKLGDEVDFKDWLSYMQDFVHERLWERLVKWLRWLGPHISSQNPYYSDDYFGLWSEADAHVEVEKEYREVMVALLPGSYRHYANFLVLKEEYEAWADLGLLLNLSPMHMESADLRLVEKADIRLLLPLYHYAAEASIQGKNRADYKQAVKELKKLATAYKKLKQTPRFEAYVQQLSKQYSRYRAFQEELRKGKLIL